jgi:hypothetical protein
MYSTITMVAGKRRQPLMQYSLQADWVLQESSLMMIRKNVGEVKSTEKTCKGPGVSDEDGT